MQFMIVEQFRNAEPLPIYRRFRDRGRLANAAFASSNTVAAAPSPRASSATGCAIVAESAQRQIGGMKTVDVPSVALPNAVQLP